MPSDVAQPSTTFTSQALRLGVLGFMRHSVGLSLLVATMVGLAYLTAGRLGSSFQQVIEQKINQRLSGTGMEIAFNDIQFVEGKGIRIDDVQVFLTGDLSRASSAQDSGTHHGRIAPVIPGSPAPETGNPGTLERARLATHYRPPLPFFPSNNTPRQPQIRIEQLWLKGDWSPANFLSGEFQPDAIEILGPTVEVNLDRNGKPILPRIRLPKPQQTPPDWLIIRDGILSVSCQRDPTKQWAIQLPLLELHRIAPGTAAGPAWMDSWQLSGAISALDLPPVQVQGTLENGRYRLEATGQPTHLHARLWQEFRAWVPAEKRLIEGVNGWVHLETFQMEGRLPGGESQTATVDRLWAKGNVDQLQFQHERLPQPILNVSGQFTADTSGLEFQNVQGRIGDGSFRIDGTLAHWSPNSLHARLITRNLRFSRRWVPLLPEKMQRDWQKFQPEGLVSCDVTFRHDETGHLAKNGVIKVSDLSYVFADFPVPISGGRGTFELNDRDCTYQIQVDNRLYPLAIDGYANNMGPQWTGRVNIKSTQYHDIDESLYLGLQKKPQAIRVIREINPAGKMAINGLIQKSDPDEKADVRFNIKFHAGEVQHVRFPYRVFGIEGEMRFENGAIFADRLVGVSSTGNIHATGEILPDEPWHISITGQAVELNSELYRALSPAQQEVWNHLSPRGILDRVVVELYEENQQCKIRVSGAQKPSIPSDPSYLSINADWFPYQLDSLSGQFLFQDDQVFLRGIRGNHGNVGIAFDGSGNIQGNNWQVTIHNLLTGQIPIDHDIKTALPETVKTAAEQLMLEGSVSVQGSVTISREPEVDPPGSLVNSQNPPGSVHRLASREPLTYRMQDSGEFQISPPRHRTVAPSMGSQIRLVWDLRLDMEDASLQVGLPAHHVHGMVQLKGQSSSQQAYCLGSLQIDSAIIEDMQVTGIQGPIGMDEREITFGTHVRYPTPVSEADRSLMPVAHSMTMNSMGARISLDGRVLLVDDMPFSVQATVDHMDLKQIAANFAPETRDVAGLGYASLALNGSAAGTHKLTGNGMVRIQEARLYEVPLFLQLLKVLRVRTPDKTAFDEGKIDFQIAGEDIQLNRIELNGDAISLLGRGQANLNQEIDLDFYTVLGRNQLYLPFLSDLAHIGSQQLLWITVDGTIADPHFKHETGRAINEAVRLLLEDLEAASRLKPYPVGPADIEVAR